MKNLTKINSGVIVLLLASFLLVSFITIGVYGYKGNDFVKWEQEQQKIEQFKKEHKMLNKC